MDIVTKEQRSRNMAQIKSKNSKPELFVRRSLYKEGFRYRLHSPIKGRPDIVFNKIKVAVFVNGCFWHMHNCKKSTYPKSNVAFWKNKLMTNIKRDKDNLSLLKKDGWKVRVLWECRLEKDYKKLLHFLNTFSR